MKIKLDINSIIDKNWIQIRLRNYTSKIVKLDDKFKIIREL